MAGVPLKVLWPERTEEQSARGVNALDGDGLIKDVSGCKRGSNSVPVCAMPSFDQQVHAKRDERSLGSGLSLLHLLVLLCGVASEVALDGAGALVVTCTVHCCAAAGAASWLTAASTHVMPLEVRCRMHQLFITHSSWHTTPAMQSFTHCLRTCTHCSQRHFGRMMQQTCMLFNR